ETWLPGPIATNAGVSEAVITLALLWIREHLVSLGCFLELLLGLRIVWVAIGMILERHLAIGPLDLLLRRAAVDAEYLVVVVHLCEVGGRRSEVGNQRSELRGRRSEIRGQRSKVRGRKPDLKPAFFVAARKANSLRRRR